MGHGHKLKKAGVSKTVDRKTGQSQGEPEQCQGQNQTEGSTLYLQECEFILTTITSCLDDCISFPSVLPVPALLLPHNLLSKSNQSGLWKTQLNSIMGENIYESYL